VSGQVSRRVARYRFRSTFGRRWSGYLTIVLLLGLLGGLSTAAIAGARRTQSSFPAFLRSTNPSDLLVYHDDSADDNNASDPSFLQTIARLPHVKHVESLSVPSEQVLGPDGAPDTDAAHRLFDSSVTNLASLDGLLFGQDRLTVLRGRLLDPTRPDEMVMSADAARSLHLNVGDRVPFGFYTNAQTVSPGYGTGQQRPVERILITVVGIVDFNFSVVRDDFDRQSTMTLFSPALTRPLRQCCSNGVLSGVQLDHGARDDAAVEAEIKQSLPKSRVLLITAVDAATAERAIEPQSIALGVFGAIAALAALLVVAQAIGRELRRDADGRDVLRALGAGPGMTVLDALVGVVASIIVGAILAAVVAVLLSPLAPLGPVRPVYPTRGFAIDWTALAIGVAGTVVVLAALATAMAYRQAPHRAARRSPTGRSHRPNVANVAARSGLPVSAVAGIRLAVDPGRNNRAVPVRSAIVGAALTVVVVVATVVFGTSLHTLVSRPPLYGWNWDDELLGPFGGFADVPQPLTGTLLNRDPTVAAWTSVSFDNLRLDGETVPVLGTTINPAVAPPLLSGHGLEAPNQVVLGTGTLQQLHKHLGDTVVVDNGVAKPSRLVIVGTATLPAIGVSNGLHLEIATGAVLSATFIPPADRGFGDLPTSPEAVFVRFRAGADPVAADRALQQIANKADVRGHGPLSVVTVQRPAEIVNYRSMGSTPALLGAALAAGALTALGLTLMASVRRRRRDLALFKTLGFTRRQLAATVAWQASVSVTIGVVVGVPFGVIAGRGLWTLFAHALHVVAEPAVPSLTIALIAVGALVLANLVAAIPGYQAAHTPSALLLQAE
jgi:hypothetical protein